ncbi:MAG: type VI secretion system tube protein Hcp [Candidatus Omnitrophica bacterium]|nr:type VI secretion system tube protein Hcp [Candidatus Omnitrophota bacterium]
MCHLIKRSSLLLVIPILTCAQAQATITIEYLVLMTVVDGQSTQTYHTGIANFAFSDGSVRSVRSAGAGGGPHVRVFSGVDSTTLFSVACSDAEISEATVMTTIRDDQKPDEETHFLIVMRDLLVTSYQTGGSAGDAPPVEELTLNFQEVETIYRHKAATGEVQETRSGVNVCLGDGSVRFK